MPSISVIDQQKGEALRTNFRYFARWNICIEGKNPGEVLGYPVTGKPLEFNTAQEYLDYAINKMLEEVGWVRIIIVKGRQQGISTYIEMRLLWLAWKQANTKICIISHEASSTASLFQKAKFAHKNLPSPIRPELQAANRNEMVFDNESRYLILTAGSEESGRSQTAHHQHESERGFYEHADKIDAGAGQIVADVPGSERYRESTGNGMNHFYQDVLDALAGKGKWRVVFIPWYWQDEYRTQPKDGFKAEPDEQILVDLYGLDNWQLQWRRDKISELKSLRKFKQEYPNTLMEAFQASGNAFYDPDMVAQARKSKYTSDFGPIVFGVDPGRTGDRTIIVIRRGRQVIKIIKYDYMDQMRLAGILAKLIDEWGADKVFIDWGMGHGTIDRLLERGYGKVVEGVNFGGIADDEEYLNKRAEMAFTFRDWLAEGNPKLPDDEDMAADIGAMPDFILTSNGRIKFPSKDEIRKTYGRSPDILDAIMLTFAYPVRSKGSMDGKPQKTLNTKRGSSLSTLRRVRQDGSQEDKIPTRRGRFETGRFG